MAGGLLAVLGKMGKGGSDTSSPPSPPPSDASPDETDSSGSSSDDNLTSMADEILQALDSKDPAALADALKAFVSECTAGSSTYSKEGGANG